MLGQQVPVFQILQVRGEGSPRHVELRLEFLRVEFTPTGEVVGHLVHILSDDIQEEERNRYTVELNPITGMVSYVLGVHKEYDQVRNEFEFR